MKIQTSCVRVLLGVLISATVVSCSRSETEVIAAPESPSGEDRREAAILYDQISRLHHEALKKARTPRSCVSDCSTPTMREFGLHLTEARLWTRTYPREAERVSFAVARNESSDPDDRDLAIAIVGVLAAAGNPAAEQLLWEISSSPCTESALSALSELSQSDVQGKYRKLYQSKARELQFMAIDVLGHWKDPTSREILETIIAQDSGPARGLATRSLKRLEWLESPDWMPILSSILEARAGMQVLDIPWALRIAVRQPFPGVREILRKRLRDAEADYAVLYDLAWVGVEPCVADGHILTTPNSTFLLASADWNFDAVLKALADLGGELTDAEKERLHFLGYGADPKRRLLEFAARWE